MTMDSEKIEKKFSKIFRILGVVTYLQIDFLQEHQLLATFCDLILIKKLKTFNLSHMTTFGVAWGKKLLRNYEKITTKS